EFLIDKTEISKLVDYNQDIERLGLVLKPLSLVRLSSELR
ncbi:1778_t:CDS:1, partial [Cetraspora pellucida]